jgi:hypothetical protein
MAALSRKASDMKKLHRRWPIPLAHLNFDGVL